MNVDDLDSGKDLCADKLITFIEPGARAEDFSQKCPICGKGQPYSTLYPNYICVDCISKVTDKNGEQVLIESWMEMYIILDRITLDETNYDYRDNEGYVLVFDPEDEDNWITSIPKFALMAMKIDAKEFMKKYEIDIVDAGLQVNGDFQLWWEPFELYIGGVLCSVHKAIFGGFVVLPVLDKSSHVRHCTDYCILRLGSEFCLGNMCTVQTDPKFYFEDAMPSGAVRLFKELGWEIYKNFNKEEI